MYYNLINTNTFFDVKSIQPYWSKLPKNNAHSAIKHFRRDGDKLKECVPKHLYMSMYDEPKDIYFLTSMFMHVCQIPQDGEVMVQAQRVTVSENQKTVFINNPRFKKIEYFGIMCVNKKHVIGGDVKIIANEDDEVLFSKPINPGELLIVDELKARHELSPITLPNTLVQELKGHYDLLLFEKIGV
jgi:hypothetical protein